MLENVFSRCGHMGHPARPEKAQALAELDRDRVLVGDVQEEALEALRSSPGDDLTHEESRSAGAACLRGDPHAEESSAARTPLMGRSEYKGYTGSPRSRSALLKAPAKPIPPLSTA